MNRPLTIGSLFSGIGGLELGLERAGLGPVVWQVEKDEYCRAVLAKHWPDATRYEDVKDVGAHNLAAVDVVCGGFPCQDISYAGPGRGLDGARSGLWYEYARIIGQMGPRYVIVENVAALLTRDGGRWFGAILGTLADLGYDAEWSCIQAADVGAAHWRDRIFILAYTNGQRQLQPQGRQPHERRRTADGGAEGNAPDTGSLGQPGPRRPEYAGYRAPDREGETGHAVHDRGWAAEPDVGRMAHGIPAGVDRLTALGNAVVPQVAEVVGRVVLALEAERLASEAA